MSDELSIVGQSLVKPDAMGKVSGQTKFADDLMLPRMLFGRLLRSPYPHARIRRIDTSKATAIPGVLAVLTGEDLPVKFGILPVSQDEEALAREKVRYVGDPVAAVAATDEWIADEAIDRIEVEFEELPRYMSLEEALADGGGEPIHGRTNVHKAVALEFGDTEEAISGAAHQREDIVFFEGNTHLPMEQHAAVAQYGQDGRLTLWSSTQTPHYVHRALGKVLEMPMSRIRVIATPNGGGFGGKSDIYAHELDAAKLAKVAEELGIDPVNLRLRNLPEPNSRTVNWLRITSCGLRACIEKVAAESRFLEQRRAMPAGRGLGFAVSSYLSGAGTAIYWNEMPHSEVQLKVDRGGGVALLCGAIDIGQGSDHILAAIAAEVLGVSQLHTPQNCRTLQGVGRRAQPCLLLLGSGGGGRLRRPDRRGSGPAGVDRARHRPRHQPHAGGRPGGG